MTYDDWVKGFVLIMLGLLLFIVGVWVSREYEQSRFLAGDYRVVDSTGDNAVCKDLLFQGEVVKTRCVAK